jgi:hypothetical protein
MFNESIRLLRRFCYPAALCGQFVILTLFFALSFLLSWFVTRTAHAKERLLEADASTGNPSLA